MRMLSPVAVLVGAALSLGACASAGQNSDDGDDSDTVIVPDSSVRIDARTETDAAEEIDAPPSGQTLSQTDSTLSADGGLACSSGANFTFQNSWFRVFDLATLGITGPFTVDSVSFGVQNSTLVEPIGVAIGTYTGTAGGATLPGSVMSVASTSIDVAGMDNQVVTVPLAGTIPANSKLIVQIYAPTGEADGTVFFLGTSAGTESTPGYLQAADCGVVPPESLRALQAGAGAAIITVTGH